MVLGGRSLLGPLVGLGLLVHGSVASSASPRSAWPNDAPFETRGEHATLARVEASEVATPSQPVTREGSTKPTCPRVASVAPGFKEHLTLEVGGATRTYSLSVPTDSAAAYPVVFAFHGAGLTGSTLRAQFPIEDAARAAGGQALFVWPEAGDGGAFEHDVDPPENPDVDFFDALVTTLSGRYCVDPAKVFVVGFGSGATFANQLARWRSDTVKGNASQSGEAPYAVDAVDVDLVTGGPTLAGSVPTLLIGDPVGQERGSPLANASYFEAVDGCEAGSSAWTLDPCVQVTSCAHPVVECGVAGLGETPWRDAPLVVWSFFASLP